jgi:hypothetical protein
MNLEVTMGRLRNWLIGCVLLLGIGWSGGEAAVTETVTRTVTINTDATDFTIVSNVANRIVRVTHIDVQNIGTTGKVAFQLCDGPCASATAKIGPFELSPGTASTQGGGWTFACSGTNCAWTITPGNSLFGQASTGATNNVRVHITYEYYQR